MMPADSALSDAEIAQSLLLGLRNRWYPILASRRLGAEPLGITRLNEALVVWRDHAGVVRVLQDRCPHRAVKLSRGMSAGDRLRCAYHGVEIGGDGRVLRVPGQPGCALEQNGAVRAYPAQEIKGAIFAWFGDALHADPAPFTPPAELADDATFEALLCDAEWPTPWRYAYDNNMDPMHGTFLHAKSHSMYQGDAQADFRTRDLADGFVFEKVGQRDTNFDWSEFHDHGSLFVRLEIPYPPSGGPGGNFGIIFHATPIDAQHMAGFYWRFRRVSGWQRDVWRFLYKNRLEARHWAVLEQDRAMLADLPPGQEGYERLYAHDAGVVRMRRHLAQQARANLSALQEAGLA